MATLRVVVGLRSRPAALVVILSAAVALGFILLYLICSTWIYEVDLGVYRDGALSAWRNTDLYSLRFAPSGLPFTYPPAAAVLLTPFALLPVVPSQLIWTIGCIASVVAFAIICVRRYLQPTPKYARVAVAVTIALALGCDPTRVGTLAGQINALLALVIVLDLNRMTGRLPQGVLIGLAAGVKLIPLFLIMYLLVTRRFKAAIVATITFGLVTAIGLMALPQISASYWDGYFWDSQRIGGIEYISNQSIHGVLIRTLGGYSSSSVPWLVAAVVLTVASMWVCRRIWRQLPRAADAVAIGAMLLVSPVSWSPHWILVLPIILVAFRLAWLMRSKILFGVASVTAACISIGFIWFVPHNHEVEYRHAWWQVVIGNSYVLLGLALTITLGACALRWVDALTLPTDIVDQIRKSQLRSAVTRRWRSSSVL